MALQTDEKLSLEGMGLYSIMANCPEEKNATAEQLTQITNLSFKKVLCLLKYLIEKGFVIQTGDRFSAVPEKANTLISR